MTPEEFSAKIKEKNPSLQAVDDYELAMKVIKANPGMKSMVDFSVARPTPKTVEQYQSPVAKEPSLFDKTSKAFESVLKPASDFMTGSLSKTIGTAISAPILEFQGKHQQAEKLKKENITPGNIAFTALEMYPGGGFVTSALKKVPGGNAIAKILTEHVPEGLREQAVKQYSEALGATTKELKAKTAKVSPELLKRGVSGGLQSLKSGAEQKLISAGDAIKKAGDNIPLFSKSKVKPLVDRANTLRQSYIVDGKVFDEGAVKAIDDAVTKITQYGKEIPDTSLLKIRRLLDRSVAVANKNFTKDEGLSLSTEVNQSIANSIRGLLNTKHPKLGAANKEFSLWSDVSKIVDATLERRSTQGSGLTRFVGPLLGAGAGAAATGDVVKGAVAYFATDAAIKLFQSPAYKTISSVNKNKLADYIASGKIKEATLLTSKLLNGLKNLSNE